MLEGLGNKVLAAKGGGCGPYAYNFGGNHPWSGFNGNQNAKQILCDWICEIDNL